jgi:ELWxxDGT repeat protein
MGKWSVWLVVAVLAGCGEGTRLVTGVEEVREAHAALDSGPATLVKDLQTTPFNRKLGEVRTLFAHGPSLYFAGNGGATGVELWRTDGTAQGTLLVKDIVPGTGGSSLGRFAEWNGELFFLAFTSQLGMELWSTDGTTVGTRMRADLHPGGSEAVSLRSVLLPTRHGVCFGREFSVSRRAEVWCSNGTPAGTVRLPGPWEQEPSEGPTAFFTRDGFMYFRTGHTGQLWRTDGTLAGTQRVDSGAAGLVPGAVTFQGQQYFRAQTPTLGNGLWRTDGTEAGTVLVKDFPLGGGGCGCDLQVVNGALWLAANSEASGLEVWKSDGTPEGTVQVADVFPGAPGSEPRQFTPLGERTVVFAASRAEGRGLWRTDGTAEGTVFLGLGSVTRETDTIPLVSFNGVLYFAGSDNEPWRTDGTPEGTWRVKDLRPGDDASAPTDFTVWQGALYFSATDADGMVGLWRTDGTAEGTQPVLDVPGKTGTPSIRSPTVVGSRLYFRANSGSTNAPHLWTSDGTAEGTVPLCPLPPASFSEPPALWLAGMGGQLYFRNQSAQTGVELWLTDGTPQGTRLLKDLVPGTGNSNPDQLTSMGGTVYFRASHPDTGRELWKTDGTPEGTLLVKDLAAGTAHASPQHLTPMGDVLYFVATTPETGSELWRTDGTPEGTRLVKDLVAGPSSGTPTSLSVAGSTLYFQAQGQLWKSDGTPEGTAPLKAASPGWLLGPFLPMGRALYFQRAQEGAREGEAPQAELWKTDGTPEGTVLLHSARGAVPLAAMGGWLYFQAEDAVAGSELWKTDGTVAGTARVLDPLPGQRGGWSLSGPVLALEPEGRLLFAAADPEGSVEPWMSDGTPEGTLRVQDLAPGPLPSNPADFVRLGERVLFTANDGLHGQELWALPVSELRDRIPPTVTCPQSMTVEATSAQGRPVDYPPAAAFDTYTASPVLTYSHPSGTTFPVGETAVTVTATDERGNRATCGFTITVTPMLAPPPPPPPPPVQPPVVDEDPQPEPKGGCASGASGVGVPWLALVTGAWLARRRRVKMRA